MLRMYPDINKYIQEIDRNRNNTHTHTLFILFQLICCFHLNPSNVTIECLTYILTMCGFFLVSFLANLIKRFKMNNHSYHKRYIPLNEEFNQSTLCINVIYLTKVMLTHT